MIYSFKNHRGTRARLVRAAGVAQQMWEAGDPDQ